MKRTRSVMGLLLALMMLFGCMPVIHAEPVRDASLDAALNGAGASYTYTSYVCRGGGVDVVSGDDDDYAVLYAAEEEQGDYETYIETTVIAAAGDKLIFDHAASLNYMVGANVYFGTVSGGAFTELYANEDENGIGEMNGQTVSEWETYTYTIPSNGAYTFRWKIAATEDDSYYAVNNIRLDPPMTLDRAVNAPGCGAVWNNDPDNPWEPWVLGGMMCIKSGRITHNESTSVTTDPIVLFAGNRFSARIASSCENNYDMMNVHVYEIVDGQQTEIDGSHYTGNYTGWTLYFGWEAAHDGVYVFRFEYAKDSSVSQHDDCVYISSAVHDKPSALHAFADDESESWFEELESGSEYTFVPVYRNGEVVLESNNTGLHSTMAELNLSIYLNKGESFGFEYDYDTEASYDKFTLLINGTEQLEKSGSSNGFTSFSFSPADNGTITLTFRYTKDRSVSKGRDSVLLKNLHVIPDELNAALNEEGASLRFMREQGADNLELIETPSRYYAYLSVSNTDAIVSHREYMKGFEYISFDYMLSGNATLTFIAWDGVEHVFTGDGSAEWTTYYYRIPSSDPGYFAWEMEIGSYGCIGLDNIHFGPFVLPVEEALYDPETDAYPESLAYYRFEGRYDPNEPRGVTQYAYANPAANDSMELSWTIDAHAGDTFEIMFKFFDEDGEANGSSFDFYQDGDQLGSVPDSWLGENLERWALYRIPIYKDGESLFTVIYNSQAQAPGDGFGAARFKHTVLGVSLDEALNAEGSHIHFSDPGEGSFLPTADEDSDRFYGRPEFLFSDESFEAYYSFEADEDLSGWRFLDEDGDSCGFAFSAIPEASGVSAPDGSRVLLSGSAFSGTAADPFDTDNWAISPAFTVPKGSSTSYVSFLYAAIGGTQHPEVFDVCALPDGDIEKAETLFTFETTRDGWDNVALSLYEYEGKTISIAFRHYTSTGAYGILFDNFHIMCKAPVYAELSFTQNILVGDTLDFDTRVIRTDSNEISNPILMVIYEDDSIIYNSDSASMYSYYGEDWKSETIWGVTPGEHTYRVMMSVSNPDLVFNSTIQLDEIKIGCRLLLGDVDGNGTVVFSDVSLLVSYLLNECELSEDSLARADVNRDGLVDILDVTAICELLTNA